MPTSEAQRRSQKKYNDRNKAKNAERARLYEEKNKERRRIANAKWRSLNPDKVKAAKDVWNAAQKAARPSKQEKFYKLVGDSPDLSILDARQLTIIKFYYGLDGETPQSDPQIAKFFNTTRQNINLERLQALKRLCASATE